MGGIFASQKGTGSCSSAHSEKTDLQVGAIGLGCMSFAGVYGSTDEAGAHRTLAAALDLGVTHLDTAVIYGSGVSENYIGSFIRDNGNRFTIATKAGIVTRPDRRFDNTQALLRNSWKPR